MESDSARQAQRSAVSAGAASALPWGVASGAGVFAAHKMSPAFARGLGVSGKVALAITPPIFAFMLAGEQSVIRDQRGAEVEARRAGGSTWHLRLANVFMEHTLVAFGVVITPMYGAILYSELNKPRYEGWRLSHAIIHTRVYGQAAAVGSLVLVFGFKDTLRRMGAPFRLDDDK